MNKNKLKKLLLSHIILFFINCTISPRNPLDSSQPLGAIYQLIPIFFPGLRPSSAKEMKTYFLPTTGSSAIITGTKMSLIVPYSTNLNSLSAEFYHTGKSSKVNGIEQISGQTVNSHSQALVYTITAANATQKSYTLSTAKGSPDSNTLFGFQFDSFNSRGVIVGTNVTVYLPFETNLNNLTPTFSHDGMKALVGGIEQISNRTSSNFSSPVLFDVQAFNGTTRQYTISTSVGSSNSKEIKSFILNSSVGSISGTNIFISIPFGTTVTNLAAAFAHTGKKVLVNGIEQINGETENDFTNSVRYTVVAADNSTQDYNVIVNLVNPNGGINTIQSFTDNGEGTIKDNNTGLTWMKCSIGNGTPGVPLTGNCSGTAGTYQFCTNHSNDCNGGSNSLPLQSPFLNSQTSTLWNACNNANSIPIGGFAGRTNWRVPSRDELVSILDYNFFTPSINGMYFPNTITLNYWSSTPYAPFFNRAWYVDFDDGAVSTSTKSTNFYVRCVSGQ